MPPLLSLPPLGTIHAVVDRLTTAWGEAAPTPPPPPRSADLFMILFVSIFLFITAALLRLVPWVSPLHAHPRWRDGLVHASDADALRAWRHFAPYGALDGAADRPPAPTYEALLEIGDRIGVAKGGFTEEQIAVLETYVCDEDGREDSRRGSHCAICRDKYRKGDLICVLPCGDEYHADCIAPWLRQQATCPLCRCRFA